MQQRQSTASVGSRARRQALGSQSGQKKSGSDVFATPAHSTTSKLEACANDDAPYFHKRLARTQGRRGSSYVDTMAKRKTGGSEVNDYGIDAQK